MVWHEYKVRVQYAPRIISPLIIPSQVSCTLVRFVPKRSQAKEQPHRPPESIPISRLSKFGYRPKICSYVLKYVPIICTNMYKYVLYRLGPILSTFKSRSSKSCYLITHHLCLPKLRLIDYRSRITSIPPPRLHSTTRTIRVMESWAHETSESRRIAWLGLHPTQLPSDLPTGSDEWMYWFADAFIVIGS